MIEPETNWLGLAALAAAIASVHLWLPWFDDRFARFRGRWVGFVGGIALGYAILYMLPKLGRLTGDLLPPGTPLDLAKLQIYLLMLAAIVIYLVMERLDQSTGRLLTLARTFDYLVHGLYNCLIGFVFVEFTTQAGLRDLLAATILALHLVGMTHLLRTRHPLGYDRKARWVYLLLVLAGAGLGLFTELPKLVINTVTAFLAGIILVNVISEELPTRHPDRLSWFIAGVGVFIVLLTAIFEVGEPILGS